MLVWCNSAGHRWHGPCRAHDYQSPRVKLVFRKVGPVSGDTFSYKADLVVVVVMGLLILALRREDDVAVVPPGKLVRLRRDTPKLALAVHPGIDADGAAPGNADPPMGGGIGGNQVRSLIHTRNSAT